MQSRSHLWWWYMNYFVMFKLSLIIIFGEEGEGEAKITSFVMRSW